MRDCFVILLLLAAVGFGLSERLSDHIYLYLVGGKYSCFRLLNGTHEVGCESSEEGNEGVVIYAADASQIIEFTTNKNEYIDVIFAFRMQLLDDVIIKVLDDIRIRGVLLLDDDVGNGIGHRADNFSEDAVCPNDEFSLYNSCENKWNGQGAITASGFRFINFKKPVFIIDNQTEIDIIKHSCYETFNRDNRGNSPVLCTARMKLFMRAAGNTEICLRRQEYFSGFSETSISLCDPLEDRNVLASVPAVRKNSQQKLLLLVSRMDSFSSFTDASAGDVSAITSIISLLIVAKTIGKNLAYFEKRGNDSDRAILFVFFHGESLGYIGSSATVHDMESGQFPMGFGLSNIDAFIEVQQLDGSNSSFVAHVDSVSYGNPRNKKKIDALIKAANVGPPRNFTSKQLMVELNQKYIGQLPPSSFQTFLKKKRNIPGFVISPFGEKFNYRRINSLGDRDLFINDTDNLKQQIVTLSSAILNMVAEFLNDVNASKHVYSVDEQFVSTLIGCFLVEPDWRGCTLFLDIMKKDSRIEHYSKNTYISAGHSPSLIRVLVDALLVSTLGSKNAVNVPDRSQCADLNRNQKIYRYTWQYDPDSKKFICYRNCLYTTLAKSPAFTIDGYNMQSGIYSSWVESVWTNKEFVLFLTTQPSPLMDIIVLLSGLLFLLLSFLVMEFIYCGNRDAIDPSPPLLQADLDAEPL